MSAEPIRTSFSIDRQSRRAIKELGARYGLSQGDIVSFAPALFAAVAEASLAKRQKTLPVIRELIDQANRSLESIASVAPHLEWVIHCVIDIVEKIEAVESNSIKRRSVLGVDDDDFNAVGLADVCADITPIATMSRRSEEIPFMKTLMNISQAAGANIHAEDGVTFIAEFADLNVVANAASRELGGWLSPQPTFDAAFAAEGVENSDDEDNPR